MPPSDIRRAIEHIHTAPHQLVLEFAGAGSLALWWLHSVAGSSRTIVEATDRYSSNALADLLGFEPAAFVSVETAVAMARQAAIRAAALRIDAGPVLGVGCTAAIATDRVKRGEHRGVVAVHSTHEVRSYAITLTKGLRDRVGEETLIGRLLIYAIARACMSELSILLDLTEGEEVLEQTLDLRQSPAIAR
jgi:nicotinamide mononucleotide (NMN) deamidase PncC